MKATIDPDRCRGHGICTTICSEMFAINDDGYADVMLPEIPGRLSDEVHDAVKQCPEQAIAIS